MNKTLKVVLSVAVVLAIAGSYLFFKESSSPVVVGALSGPDIYSDYLDVNGVQTWYSATAFDTASTTRCAIQAPAGATSVLSLDSVVKAASTTNYTLAVGKAATRFATPTSIFSEAITADGVVTRPIASTTYNTLALTDRTFGAGEWLIVTAGGTATAMDFGYCSAQFNVGR